MLPTTQVSRVPGAIQTLPRRHIDSCGKLEFLPLGRLVAMDWEASLVATYTEGIVALHRRQVVFGVIAAAQISVGVPNETSTVTLNAPKREGPAFADPTIWPVLDMATTLQNYENLSDSKSGSLGPCSRDQCLAKPPGYGRPRTVYFSSDCQKRHLLEEGRLLRTAAPEYYFFIQRMMLF